MPYDWVVITWIAGMHLGALVAPFTFSWSALVVAVALWWLTGGLGVCLCYHRLLTHRSFRVARPLEYGLTLCGVLASQGSAITWVARHRLHHAYSDTADDPHSPRHGFWWSHVIWLLRREPRLNDDALGRAYAVDLIRDPVHRLLARTHAAYPILLGVALYFWGGLPVLVWGLFVRTVVVYHVTWFVNSAAHAWGHQTYAVDNDARNLWWVALLSFGEGWHNNHHAFPRSARHGLKRWECDQTYLTIKVLQWLGLAADVRIPGSPGLPPARVR